MNKYDIIFLDLNMPIMDGFEACKRIKELLCGDIRHLINIQKDENFTQIHTAPNFITLIIALSGHITEEDRVLGKEAGFDDFCNFPHNQYLKYSWAAFKDWNILKENNV